MSNYQDYSVRTTFNLPIPPEVVITGRSERTDYVPEVDAGYVFEMKLVYDILGWFKNPCGDALWLAGETGCGKTSVLEQLCARINFPCFSVTAHSRMETPELVGHMAICDGQTVFQYGPLALAMREGGLLVINEIDLMDPSTLAGLNGVMEGQPLVIPENGGEVIKPHLDFRVAVTSNTAGSGDEGGRYQGTLMQNMAFLDRFLMVRCNYPSQEVEKSILCGLNLPSVPEDILEGMVRVATSVRKAFAGDFVTQEGVQELDATMSTRTLIRWARLIERYQGLRQAGVPVIHYALQRAFSFRLSEAQAEIVHQIVQRETGADSEPLKEF